MKGKLFWVLILSIFSLLGISNVVYGNQLINNPKPNNPVMCTMIYDPVCGVDGKTYSNSCIALYQHHVQIAYKGKCKPIKRMKYLTPKNIQIIDKVLEEKLFKKIENKPVQYQVKKLNTIIKKINILSNKIKEKHGKKLDLTKEILKYIEEKINEKLIKINK